MTDMLKKQWSRFPSPESANPDGIVAVGGEVTAEWLIDAYSHAIFPWPIEGVPEMVWFSPDPRGILFLKDFHISRSLQQKLKRQQYRVTFDQDFTGVIRACAAVTRKRQNGTWIREDMIEGYTDLHRKGFAHSVECYDLSGNLKGGLYGVAMGAMFVGESMFHLESDFSKIALAHLVEKLKERSVPWIDLQVLNPFFKSLGGSEIARRKFLQLHNQAIQTPIELFTSL